MHDKKYDEARRLSEQAEWDARVAERKAQAAKAEKASARLVSLVKTAIAAFVPRQRLRVLGVTAQTAVES